MNERITDEIQKNQNTLTGIAGLDEILNGGLTGGAIHLIEGESGTGKTTLALQFSLEGMRRKETVLYLALSETHQDLKAVARSHGWEIDGLHVLEAASEEVQASSMFNTAEVELGQAIQRLRDAVDRIHPHRLVLDSLSEFRLLGQSSLRYRRELLALKRFLVSRGCTVLLLDHTGTQDSQRSLVDGVILLEASAPDYGTDRRRLRVLKLRGKTYAGGFHDYKILAGGLQVFPRLIAAEHRGGHTIEVLHSGSMELDALLGGGINTGSSTLLIGPAGSGKSTVAMLFVASAIARGETALFFSFDERPEHILSRARGLNLDLQTGLENRRLLLQQVDPAELSPGQFAHIIREQVEKSRVSIVVIDSLNGYLHAMPNERFLVLQLHELLSYLGQEGVSTFIVVGLRGLGSAWEAPIDTSYLTDNVLMFRFLETRGEIRKTIAMLKHRSNDHERTMRELHIGPGTVRIGKPIRQFQGILHGPRAFPDEFRREQDGGPS